MIDEMQVENLALIRQATLQPSPGLTVLTGETGAGKTALLSALKLLMGARADKDAVRDGQQALVVSGRFFDLGDGRDDVVVSRRVGVDGRSRAAIDGRMASVRQLVDLVAPAIDLCGQHEHQRLMRASSHLPLLDAWAADQVDAPRQAYEQAYERAAQARAELDRVREAARSSAEQLDQARFVLRQIDAVGPSQDEHDKLVADLARAEHAEALATAADGAHRALAGDGGALDALSAAIQALQDGGRFDQQLADLASSLREAGYVLEDVAAQARDYRDGVSFDAESLMRQQERMAALQGLLRSYGPRMEDVLRRRDEAAELVSLVDDAAERQRRAEQQLDEAERALSSAAEALDQARSQAAPRFAEAVTAQMRRLEMGGAQLACQVSPLPRETWTKAGPHAVEFLFRSGAGMQPRPLARIASGGEVSRVMLAVKVVLGQADDVGTLVFDEVDAGVGGSTAVALAEVLADLARTHQVIVVTHLAQVAVRGDAHYVVRRVDGPDGMPETQLARLAPEDRPAEIARMLSGDATEASLAHARELLAAAESSRQGGTPAPPDV